MIFNLIITPEHIAFYEVSILFYALVAYCNYSPAKQVSIALQALFTMIPVVILAGLNYWGIRIVFDYHPPEMHLWLSQLGVAGSWMTYGSMKLIGLLAKHLKK